MRSPKLLWIGALALIAMVTTLAACSGSESHSGGQTRQITVEHLRIALGCTQNAAPAAVTGIPGATAFACVGTTRAYVAWSSAAISAQDGEGPQPGAVPAFAELVTFTTIGAREVYAQQDALAIRREQSKPVLQQVDGAEGQLPDVIGKNWIVWGNDAAVDAAAINNKDRSVAAPTTPTRQGEDTSQTTPPAAPTPAAAIGCVVHFSPVQERTTYTTTAGTYRGAADVYFFGEKSDGSPADRPFHTLTVSIDAASETKVLPNADNEPAGHTGATVPPNTCQATAIS